MKKNTKAQPVEVARKRNRTDTAADLKRSLAHLVDSKQRVSIAAVAKAAGVTPALIHNKYPDIAEAIRKHLGKTIRGQRDDKHDQLIEAKTTIKELRSEKNQLLAEVTKLASINEALRRELAEVSAVAKAKNILSLSSRLKPSK